MSFGHFAGGMARGLSNMAPVIAHGQKIKQDKELGEKLSKIIEGKETATDVFQAVASNPQMSSILSFTPEADPQSVWKRVMQREEPGINPDYMQLFSKPTTGQPAMKPGLGAFWNKGGNR